MFRRCGLSVSGSGQRHVAPGQGHVAPGIFNTALSTWLSESCEAE
jgi:hypothetical protein